MASRADCVDDDDDDVIPDALLDFLDEHVGGPVTLDRVYADDENDSDSFEPVAWDVAATTSASDSWVADAANSLQHNGFVVLRPHAPLAARDDADACASAWLSRLARLFELAKVAGMQPKRDILRFSEMCSRTKGGLRYDMRLPHANGSVPPFDPMPGCWPQLTCAVEALVSPVLKALAGTTPKVDSIGCVTSLPGAPDQHFHPDGTAEGLYNAFCPLVPVLADNGPTELLPGSHEWVESTFGGLEPKRGEGKVPPVSPLIEHPAGAVLVFNYKCYHRGLGNRTMEPRPIAYVAFATRDVTDAHNFPSGLSLVEVANAAAAPAGLPSGSASRAAEA